MSVYPEIPAGRRITDELLESMLPLEVVKTVTETVTNATTGTTYQDDNELFLPAEVNGVYRFKLFLLHSAGTTGKFRMRFSAPSGAAVNWGVHATHVNITSSTTVADMSNPSRILSDDQQMGGGDLAGTTAYIMGTLTMGSTAGNLMLQWAQITANAAATQVRAGSWLTMKRVS
ncbi:MULTISPECIES: hypothetical protein [Streptomyces]|uniref:hypothetical protein n=1 Tax=Streptomyces TaxID=1883 RepID=UPI00324B612A